MNEEIFLQELNRAFSHSGLNKSEISRRTGIPAPMISRYFAGQVPKFDNVVKLAAVLGTTASQMLQGSSAELSPEGHPFTNEDKLKSEETNPMPYSFAAAQQPLPKGSWVEKLARQTAEEIFSRLAQWPEANANVRVLLKEQIAQRLIEFEALCELYVKPA